ncbi:SpoIIE family protein phosphatase [Streptomyces sp. NPDC094149]|uniref:SpoIIE family protein phosphatase n=1 Tax=Streptomyces sp. NPDC094149 TaxID=3155079 RepID=UPI00332F6CC7
MHADTGPRSWSPPTTGPVTCTPTPARRSASTPSCPGPDHEEALPAGAAVLLHTDGLVEDRAHALDDGMRRAADIAARHAKEPLPRLCDALLGHRRDAFDDDVALLAARLTT